MKTPSATAAKNLFDQLRALHSTKDGNTKLKTNLIDHLELRLLAALERDRTGRLAHDGWPTSTTGNGSSGLPTSSVEAAVVALVDGARPRDHHHELVGRAAGALEDAVVALNTLRSALNSIDDLTKTSVDPKAPKTCAHCTDKRLGTNHPIHATGTVGDRLERSIALCAHCYGYVTQTATPGTREGWLPSDAEILQHEERGRWRIRRPELQTQNPG